MKQYNSEKAIISLTTWKARINTVAKTLYSLIKKCPGFHIVLVLCEEEFPKKEEELPDNLRLFIDNELIEVLWAPKNLRPHLKYFYTMQKYRNVPIITCDDDIIYNENFAERLYDVYRNNKNTIIANRCHLMKVKNNAILPYRLWDWETKVHSDDKLFFTGVGGILYPPNCFNLSDNNLSEISKVLTADDVYLNALCRRNKIKKINLSKTKLIMHTNTNALSDTNVTKNKNDQFIKAFSRDFLS